jgi:hypothetical protein
MGNFCAALSAQVGGKNYKIKSDSSWSFEVEFDARCYEKLRVGL